MSLNKKQSLILGIDPGFERLGIAVVGGERGKEKLFYSSCITTPRTDSHDKRLLKLKREIQSVIDNFSPTILSIEKLFFNQNRTNALKVAEARGVALSLASENGMEVFEYSPQQIKSSVCGYGKAKKGDVKFIILKTLDIPEKNKKRLDDEFDAMAVAITHNLSGSGVYPQ